LVSKLFTEPTPDFHILIDVFDPKTRVLNLNGSKIITMRFVSFSFEFNENKKMKNKKKDKEIINTHQQQIANNNIRI